MSINALGYPAKISSFGGNSYAKSISSAQSSPASSPAPAASVSVTLSDEARAKLALREVSEAGVKSFQGILNRAQAANAGSDPKAFLRSLSAADMETLRQAHSLADPINISELSLEGASNLLVEPGKAQDLDNNGLTQIGKGNTIVFPPSNAPQSFKDAWKKATEGMSPMDIPLEMPLAISLANLHQDPVSGKPYSVEPGDARWVNPYADPNYDYGAEIERIMGGLENDFKHGFITPAQLDKEMSFYRRLTEAMG